MTAPIRSMADVPKEGELIATVRSFEDFADVFAALKDRMGLTNEFIDERGGLTKGHTDKCLGRSRQKRLGAVTFDFFTAMMAVEFRVYIDPEQIKRMEAIWEGRERPLYKPDAKPGRISKKILRAAKPIVYRETGRLGGMVTAHLRTPAQRSEAARKAALAKHEKLRKNRVR